MTRILEINACRGCPFGDIVMVQNRKGDFTGIQWVCSHPRTGKKPRKVPKPDNIPGWCPLSEVKQVEKTNTAGREWVLIQRGQEGLDIPKYLSGQSPNVIVNGVLYVPSDEA